MTFVSILTLILTSTCEIFVFPTLHVEHKTQQRKGGYNKGDNARQVNNNWIEVFWWDKKFDCSMEDSNIEEKVGKHDIQPQ